MTNEPNLELIAELGDDYSRRRENGEYPSIEEYESQHPHLAQEIRDFIEAIEIIYLLKPKSIASGDRYAPDRKSNLRQESLIRKNSHPTSPKSANDSKLDWPRFSDYEIVREIARGGMGIVYEANQRSLGRRVALKILPENRSSDPTLKPRFQNEARSAAHLHHSNIVPVFEVGEENETLYYAMQYIEGQGLDEVASEIHAILRTKKHAEKTTSFSIGQRLAISLIIGRHTDGETVPFFQNCEKTEAIPANGQQNAATGDLSVFEEVESDESATPDFVANRRNEQSGMDSPVLVRKYCRSVARIGKQAADAIEYAHRNGIVHRDIKPANLLLDINGTVWVADFGLAKFEDDNLTKTGAIVGTLRYMAPERFEGTCDARSDVYGLGMTLYEMLALQPAFETSGHLSLLEKIRSVQPKLLRDLNPRIPKDLQTIIQKAIEKESKRRYPSAKAFADDLERFVEGRAIQARRVGGPEQVLIWAKRNQSIASLLSLLLVGIIATLIGSSYAAFKFHEMATNATEIAEQRKQQLYYAEMNQALDAAQFSNGWETLHTKLNHWIPKEGETDLRGWEWYWMNAISQRVSAEIKNESNYNWSVTWSPDGKSVCWTNSGKVFVANWPKLDTFYSLPPESAQAPCVDFSPDGSLIAVGTFGNTVRIWDWKKQKIAREIVVGDAELQAQTVCWSPAGDLLVVQTKVNKIVENGRLIVFETADWGEVARIENYNHDRLSSIAFNHTGDRLAVGGTIESLRAKIRIFDTKTWRLDREKVIHSYPVTGLDWHPQENVICSSGSDHLIRVWNLDDDKVTTLDQAQYQSSVEWHANGNRLVFSGWNSSVAVWDRSAQSFDRFLGNNAKVLSASWNDGDNVIASSSADSRILFWHENSTPLRQFRRLWNDYVVDPRGHLKWSSDSSHLAMANSLPFAVWNVATGKVVQSQKSFSFRSARTGQKALVPLEDYTNIGAGPNWSASGNRLSSHHDSKLEVFDERGRNRLKTILLDQVRGLQAAEIRGFSPYEGKVLVQDSQANQCSFSLLDTDTEQIENIVSFDLSAPRQITSNATWHPNGNSFVVGDSTGRLILIDVENREVAGDFQLKTGSILNVSWSSGGGRIAVAGKQAVEIIDTKKWKSVAFLDEHTASVESVCWNESDNRLASASEDKTIRIWNTATWETILVFRHEGPVTAVAWSPDGKKLASMNQDGIVTVRNAALGYQRAEYEPQITTHKALDQTIQVTKYE